MSNLTIIIPSKDEAETLPKTLLAIQFLSKSVDEILVIVDDIQDKTFNLDTKSLELNTKINILLSDKPGVANAISKGLDNSRNDFILICMADELTPLLQVDKFYNEFKKGFQFISATRYAKGGKRYGGSPIGKVLSTIANFILRSLYFKFGLSDWTTGMKGINKQSFKSCFHNFNGKGWSIAIHLANFARINKLNTTEIPIISVDRIYGGTSKFQAASWSYSYLRLILQIIRKKQND